MKLAKWQGLGNDYLIVERSALPGPLSATVIGVLCDRHLGVGSDGILLVDAPTGTVPGAVARMRVFNPDGSEPEMCGNGIRMFARYLARSGAVSEPEFVVETLAGAIRPRLLDDGRVRVDMGQARFRSANVDPGALSTHGAPPARGWPSVPRPGRGSTSSTPCSRPADTPIRFTFVDVGNPHCVILVDDPAGFDVSSRGRRHRASPRVPQSGQRGVRAGWRPTAPRACGCGRGAWGRRRRAAPEPRPWARPCVRLGLATSPVLVHLLGGDLTIEVVGEDGVGTGGPGVDEGAEGAAAGALAPRVFMTGPAEEVFRGELSPDLLHRMGWATTAGD